MHCTWLVLLLTLATVTRSEHYHIVPVDLTDLCNDYRNGTCFTLEQLVQTALLSGGDNLSLSFLPGDHILREMLYIYNFREVIIAGQNATISLNSSGRVQLSNISALSIEGLHFTGAGDESSSGYMNISQCYLVDLKLLKLEACTLWITRTVTVTIEQVLFVNNTGIDRALRVVEADTVYIEKSDFFSNDGGAVKIKSNQTVINGSRFDSNTAAYGGAVFVVSASVTISWSNFTNNSAYHNGGAISTSESNLTIYNCALLNNSAILDGGAIYSQDGSVSISDSELAYNSAIDSGGAIYSEDGSVSISDSELAYNSAEYGGAILTSESNLFISNCTLLNNSAIIDGGAILTSESNLFISNCALLNNSAIDSGGAIYSQNGSVSISDSELAYNSAEGLGGAIFTFGSNLTIYNCALLNNSAIFDGGAINIQFGNFSISDSELAYNSAERSDGAISVLTGELLISDSELTNNKAASGGAIGLFIVNASIMSCNITDNEAVVDSDSIAVFGNGGTSLGGAILVYTGNISISKVMFKNNSADFGGVFFVAGGTVNISDSVLTNNRATQQDGVIAVAISTLIITNTSIFDNLEGENIIYAVHSNLSFTGVNNVSNNVNPVYALSSRVEFNGPTTLSNNRGVQGGAIRAIQSQVYINAEGVVISNNTATVGGGVFLRESTLFVHYPIEISHNTAQNGGGIYAYSSEIEFDSKVTTGCIFNNNFVLCTCSDIEPVLFVSIIDRNDAQNGGGIYAVASNIKAFSHAHVQIKSNSVNNSGGGVYLQQSSKIYILKQDLELEIGKMLVILEIHNNTAQYGGGIFVADSTESGVCRGEDVTTAGDLTQTECFIQTLDLYGFDINFVETLIPFVKSSQSNSYEEEVKCLNSTSINHRNTFLTNNTASQSGADIYGGLLDRCTVDVSAELSSSDNGFEYLNNTVHYSWIASKAVRVKLCNTTKQTISVRKGQAFTISVMAVDQAGNPMNNAIIHSSVITESSRVDRLKEGQAQQEVGNQCTELEYNVFSQDSSAQVELYADGPCNNLGISRQILNISFLKCECPIGLRPIMSSIECKCDCDPVLQQEYQITNCSEENGTIKLESNNNIWIGVTNTTNGSGYVVSNCTFDYCVLKPVNISLSNPDEQCAHNRSGVLCGECEPGLSLVLGTSRCELCSNTYLLLLLPFALAGIVLVAFILVFNITVATGTIHGLIFYTNVLAANQSIFVPFHNPLTVFISWVNLDLGIETCFYDRMNSQAKVLLQIVFPAYLFLLMFLIIILSKYFDSFAKLLSNRNPVAALGTLVLLSYSKLLRFIIAALQYRVLDYPDGATKVLDFPNNSSDIVWLYDGNVQYFTPGHVPRFIFAAIILISGILFTVLLFFGQWLPRCSKWKLTKWTKNTYYIGFMDAYHAPFTPKHRYWVGLLLFSLIAHNLITALALDTSLPVLSAGSITVGLIVFKSQNYPVYKIRFNDLLETLFFLNLAILAYGTLYIGNINESQVIISNISMAVAFILFVVIVCYHCYEYMLKKVPVLQNSLKLRKRIPRVRKLERYEMENKET
ncbi:uncharacterized protein LOC135337873 [Halichondria panicea]|uniref:uncharacterized protein LOC135337873 n=1 Tax=Halichondria panicea TaxID=6063 RepID=UPI00312BB2F7